MTTVSNAPWDGDPARFSDSEYRASAILDRGGDGSVKERYGLAVREPDGTVNRHALAAAAAALNGGRGGVTAPDEAKASARATLTRLYSQAGLTAAVSKSETVSERIVPIWKDEDAHIVYGVVMSPGIEDSQGDIATAAEIEKAAHRFLTDYRQHDVQHSETLAGVHTVENYIAPQDLVIAGEKVLKGAWVMATHVTDPEVWARVRKGELTGYSVMGDAIRDPTPA